MGIPKWHHFENPSLKPGTRHGGHWYPPWKSLFSHSAPQPPIQLYVDVLFHVGKLIQDNVCPTNCKTPTYNKIEIKKTIYPIAYRFSKIFVSKMTIE